MSGANGDAVGAIADGFNKSQTKCFVQAIFQGSYDDELNKLKAGMQSGDIPTVIQLYDLGTRLMYDLDMIVPMQTLIDKEKFDVSDIEPNIMGYYSVGGKLYSMPFNTSNPILYYNKDMFKAAGLDPEQTAAHLCRGEGLCRQADQEGRRRQGHAVRLFDGDLWLVL